MELLLVGGHVTKESELKKKILTFIHIIVP